VAEKTEKATPKKLRDARKKGQVAKSQDFPAAFTFVVSIGGAIASAGYIMTKLIQFLVYCFRSISPTLDLSNSAAGFLSLMIQTILAASLPLMMIVSLVGVIVNFLIIGPCFSAEAMKFDLKKLNPVTNIKNKFKFKTLFELLKSIFKIGGAVAIIYFTLKGSIEDVVSTVTLPILKSVGVFSDFLVRVVIRVGVFFLAVGVADLVFQRRNFAKEMKMEKFEVKQEYKDTEGDPMIKGKRKQMAQELSQQEGISSVRRAKAIVTNPTHLAVALAYDSEVHNAPVILTMGQGIIAEAIVKEALAYKVPVMRNVELAWKLFEEGDVLDYIPEDTFEATAELLKWIESLEEKDEE